MNVELPYCALTGRQGGSIFWKGPVARFVRVGFFYSILERVGEPFTITVYLPLFLAASFHGVLERAGGSYRDSSSELEVSSRIPSPTRHCLSSPPKRLRSVHPGTSAQGGIDGLVPRHKNTTDLTIFDSPNGREDHGVLPSVILATFVFFFVIGARQEPPRVAPLFGREMAYFLEPALARTVQNTVAHTLARSGTVFRTTAVHNVFSSSTWKTTILDGVIIHNSFSKQEIPPRISFHTSDQLYERVKLSSSRTYCPNSYSRIRRKHGKIVRIVRYPSKKCIKNPK